MIEMNTPLSVSELNEYARRLLAGDPILKNVTVSGEISGYKNHYSGHKYFSLKDSGARIQCVMFRANAMSLTFMPQEGMKVTVRGSVSIYAKDGSYQMYVNEMSKSGLGDLYARYEALKAKLEKEGLFDPARKRELPFYPKTIGLVTSETGAAVRDMIKTARRRNPNVGIILSPCAVQGENAAPEIVRAIERLNADGRCDVLLVGRGGGSIEDLWAFNEEIVARAIANSKIPVISCVGHEIDHTIADEVADCRAATPTAAAEIAVPVLAELQEDLNQLSQRLAQALVRGQEVRRKELDKITRSVIFLSPEKLLTAPKRQTLNSLCERNRAAIQNTLVKYRHRLDMAYSSLRVLDPQNTLNRGYSITRKNGSIVTNVEMLSIGDEAELTLSNGTAKVNIRETEVKHNA